MSASDKIRVVVVDDTAETRETIRKLLQLEYDIDVVGMARNGRCTNASTQDGAGAPGAGASTGGIASNQCCQPGGIWPGASGRMLKRVRRWLSAATRSAAVVTRAGVRQAWSRGM